VVDLRVYGMYGLADEETGAAGSAQAQMDGFLTDVLQGLAVKRVLLYGDPAREITKYAEAEKTGMIVMPTHGFGPFRQFLLGSVTAKVLHDAHCPVWTGVHNDGATAHPVAFKRILCALDPWNGDHRALAWAWKFGSEVGAEVRIIHAAPAIYGADAAVAGEEIQKAQEIVGSRAAVQIVTGDAPVAVHAAAREWQADLTVISRGVASEFLGRLRSRAYSIIRESPCPVVSV